ncbi:MAG: penicillin-binding transpeptidase domain-containing protein [Akkermansiaceae bacterium]|nr:penicillin-binding transpeptidase domain-containing protein [Akkermansiaceae bacterium]MDP4647815.1 penicillin-binding transpeptidase domain-containing protein [Akkermansiaceae bacterium]MDP4721177.1 penicillin-binding transpeptidase domain-containing protein [Akkermansiaceae bacterium]MDP4779060.1 penicillin-binding transpeptidase domain-containing protein [Akkermansiaceae bacterium]MDP4845917.1 penicillin-binding transpeptidase domain-containing protein [Akkermansiaceae bacterium]
MHRTIVNLIGLLVCSGGLQAQELASTELPGVEYSVVPVEGESDARAANDGAIFTRKDARTITLKIPAPRGQIVDRKGQPMAQNEVAYQVALQYKQFQDADRAYVIDWARTRLEPLAGTLPGYSEKTDDELYDHYRHRRWLPLYVSGQISASEAKELEPKLSSDLVLYPVYRRLYPEGSLAAHIIGYSGSVGRLPTGPINFNEPLWEESEGRAGLEKIYNRELTGIDGTKRLLFDENGNKLLENQTKRPRPGGTVVTTLNLDWQKRAEKVLKNGCSRGAFVVIDVVTGEVLVMASRPSFDLNAFIPGISTEEFTALQEDPGNPLFGRAFQSAYPPASAYKPVVALAALNNGTVTEYSTVNSPASIRIGNHTFKNWSTIPEGPIDVKRALARSCNTWFYQVGIDVGPSVFLGLSRRLGMGEKSGLPLIGETPGLVPTDEWMMKNEGRRILDGDTANMSIGQGSLLASPLQVAQMMAGIGNGGALPKLSLISQVQDSHGRVIKASVPERKNWLGLDEEAVAIVREGMRDVVEKGYGTGKSGGLSFTSLAGKTGTAQWGPPSKNQRLAWFAGFLPYDNPRYAFAVLYEGKPGEGVSGGRMSAPMVRSFFEPLKDEIKEIIAPPKKALIVVPEGEEDTDDEDDDVLKAIPIDEFDLEEEAPMEESEVEEENVLRAVPIDEGPDDGYNEDL